VLSSACFQLARAGCIIYYPGSAVAAELQAHN
jgi:hypothetical protein